MRLGSSGIPGPMPTSRQAWREVRDHTEREADTRRAYCEALQGSVVRILQDLATVQGRIKGRIKEDLERATNVRLGSDLFDYTQLDAFFELADVHRPSGTYFTKTQEGLLQEVSGSGGSEATRLRHRSSGEATV